METNFMIFDDNVSLEAFHNSFVGTCSIKMYYNNFKDGYIILSATKEDLQSLISELQTIEKQL